MKPSLALLLSFFLLSASFGQTTRPAIVSAAEWGSKPQPMPDSKRHTPKYITIHHEGVAWKPADDPVKKIRALQLFGQKEKHWEDVPYHFLIAPDGRIFEGRPLQYMPESNTRYDREGHIGIELMGNFEVQRIDTPQLISAAKLIAWLCDQYHIDPDTIATHRDRAPGQTVCPGKDFYRYVSTGPFKSWVKSLLAGAAPDITLLPPLPDGPTIMIGRPLPSSQPAK